MSAPVPGAVAVAAVAWSGRSGGNYDPPQGAGWIAPSGDFIPAVRDDSDGKRKP